jgi:hypothetical protein
VKREKGKKVKKKREKRKKVEKKREGSRWRRASWD